MPRHADATATSSEVSANERARKEGVGVGWMMVIWSVVAAGLVFWFVDAEDVVHGACPPADDDDRCTSCRHDLVAHEHAEPRSDCSQCPCPGFRASG